VDVQEFYRQIYYEAIDTVVVVNENRIMQMDFSNYGKLEQLLLQATKKEDYRDTLKDVTEFYQGDFNKYDLATIGSIQQYGLPKELELYYIS